MVAQAFQPVQTQVKACGYILQEARWVFLPLSGQAGRDKKSS